MRILYASLRRIDQYLVKALRQMNHVVEATQRPDEAILTAVVDPFGAVVFDAASASADWAGRLAAAWPDAFLILIIDADDRTERLAALRAGADACFVRPVHTREIGGKLDALARRSRHRRAPDAIELLPLEQAVLVAGERVALSRREYLLLELLSRRPGETFTSEQLLDIVWGSRQAPNAAVVRTTVSRLRTKIDGRLGRRLIHGERGHGYRYRA